ncbi:hypothetical protein [Sporosarcina obsidiansis]|nr:hypothetical protein [Sporosarcina obsidiansis]
MAEAVKEKTQEYFNFNEIEEVRFDGNQKVWILKVSDGSEVKVEDR